MLTHVVRSTLEPVLNKALSADTNTAQRLRSVRGTCVAIHLREFPEPLTIRFSEEQIFLLGPDYDAIDAEVTLSLLDVPLLTDAAQATQAIQQGKLQVVGDPLLLQRAAAVFVELDIDWEELLANYLGDIPAYIISQRIKATMQHLKQVEVGQRVQEILTDETGLLATPVGLKVLQEQCLQADQRLAQLEQRLAAIVPSETLAKGE